MNSITKLYLDFETRSTADLGEVGTWKYAQDPNTEIMCMGYSSSIWDDKTPSVLSRDKVVEAAALFCEFRSLGNVFVTHGVFEYCIYNLILHRRYGWPALWEPKYWNDTMARAAACGLPLDLNNLSKALNLKTPKDLEGRRIMLQLTRPKLFDPLGSPVYEESPEKYTRLYQYNENDVRQEMEIDAALPELSPEERKVWELDLEMNRRGVCIDVDLCRAAEKTGEKLVAAQNFGLETLTRGAVDAATRTEALKGYLKKRHGLEVKSLDKEAVTTLLEKDDTKKEVREILLIKREVGKRTSVAKYTKALNMVCNDGRARGLLQYHAAHTGRWGGRGLQPQNFPKGYNKDEQLKKLAEIKEGRCENMSDLSSATRGMFIASPGRSFYVADYNAIEARILFWLAGEDGGLGEYKKGGSPYVTLARYIYGDNTITKETHPQNYDLGKRSVLGAGYGLGWKKFQATVYRQTASEGKPFKLPDELAQRAITAYREKYGAVVQLWYSMDRAAINAVQNPGKLFTCGSLSRVAFGMSKDRRFLGMKLPSGRVLRYFQPEVGLGETPWGEKKMQLTYMGMDERHQWERNKTYGGALTENVVQGIARDVLVNGMFNVRQLGYSLLLTVHDEVVSEKQEGDIQEYIAALCKLPSWALGLPIKAEGYVADRYRKGV